MGATGGPSASPDLKEIAMFQLIATTITVAALLWATALKPAHAALTTASTAAIACPVVGASLATGTNQLPESFDFAKAERSAER
jgi:hypothetical protein